MTKPKERVTVRFYRARNRLKDKVSGGVGGRGGIAKEALERAEAEFKKLAEDYPDWVGKYLAQVHKEIEVARERTPELRTPNFRRIAQIAHEIKGQGGTFGYPLMSTFGTSLYDFTSGREGSISDAQIDLVKNHHDAMQAVIRGRVSGDGGAIGAQVAKSLNEAIARYTGRPLGKS